MKNIRCYSDLILLPTFEERFEYLKLDGQVGVDTFGFDRYLNQFFYRCEEWKQIRNSVIARDIGRDLSIPDREIYGSVLVHHMNPITKADIVNRSKFLLDPEYLISTSKQTHNAIHYGDKNLIGQAFTERTKNDTCPWKSY